MVCSTNKVASEHGATTLKRRLLAGGAVLFVSSFLGGQALAADVPGFTGPDPDNAFSFDLEGCRLDKANEGTYDPTATPPVLTCDTEATWPDGADAYTDGNLGKEWNELDLVPHRVGSDSSGLTELEQTFQIIIGADYLVDDSPLKIGYDRIVNFEFNPDVSTGTAAQCQLTLIGGNSTGDFGIGGAMEQIVQVLEITQAANVRCVWDYVERLAITSSLVSGSSNRSYVVAGTGEQSVPIPSDIQPQQLAKEMSAVEDSLIKWTIMKDADPANFDFGNTCDMATPLTKDVMVTISYTKGTAEPFALVATSTVQATNPSSRNVEYRCKDELYGIAAGGMSETLLDTASRDEIVAPGMYSFDIVHNVPAGARSLRNHLSCDLYVEDILGGDDISVGTLTADFSLADNDIADGTVVNNEVTISDTESISGTGFAFSTLDPTGASGAFDGYTPGTSTTGPVLWDSDPQSASGSIVFTKSVTVAPWIDTSGTLSDTATLPLTDATDVEASASTSLSAMPLVDLTIVKTIPDILQDEETIDCNFTVKDSVGTVVASPVLTFTAGETSEQTTLNNLDPDMYTVIEGECGGLIPDGDSMQNVDLTLAGADGYEDCSATASFSNLIPGEDYATAEVNKLTFPVGLEDGWTMELKKDGVTISTLVTADSDAGAFEPFLDSGTGLTLLLEEGNYTVVETLKSGWRNTTSTGCMFTVDYPDDFGAVFQCQYTNKKLGKVIIEKQTIPNGETDQFEYTQDVDQSGNFFLIDDGQEVFSGVADGQYMVTEINPAPNYDLTNLVCTDDFDGVGYNVVDSSIVLATGVATINLDPGETVKCVYTNTKRGMVDLLKLTNGVQNPDMMWNFTLVGPDVSESDSTPPPLVDFSGAKLVAGETYTLCETGIPPTWSIQWALDANHNGAIDDGETLPYVGGMTGNLLEVYDPTYGENGASNDVRCVDFVAQPGDLVQFIIDNQAPGGEPRTPGYWKNWNTCTGGNQADTAAKNGGVAEYWFLLDDLIPTTVGGLEIATCEDGVLILDHRDLNGKKKASDAAYNLARNLLAAKLNLAAGAETCGAVQAAVPEADALLSAIGWDGIGPPGLRSKDQEYQQANDLATDLDLYNNGDLCP
jgi:hypothetical protein